MKRLLLPLLASLAIGLACYLCSSDWILSSIVAAVDFLCFLFFLVPMLAAHFDASRRGHESYRFIHAYVLSLSATSSLEKAFYSAQEGANGKMLVAMENASTLGPLEKAEFMGNYFRSDVYEMFLSVLRLYLDQGGDILRMSSSLLQELNRVEETARKKEKIASRNAFQYVLLWCMSSAILVFLRFGLGEFFASVQSTPVYRIAIGAFFLFMLGSILVFVRFLTDQKPGARTKEARKKKKEAKS